MKSSGFQVVLGMSNIYILKNTPRYCCLFVFCNQVSQSSRTQIFIRFTACKTLQQCKVAAFSAGDHECMGKILPFFKSLQSMFKDFHGSDVCWHWVWCLVGFTGSKCWWLLFCCSYQPCPFLVLDVVRVTSVPNNTDHSGTDC